MSSGGRTSTRAITLMAAAAALGGLLFGFDTSTMNAAINGIRPALGLDAGAVGFVVAIVLIGCAAGAWFAGPVTRRLGRTRVMALAGILIVAGSAGVALSGQVALVGLFRFVTGLGIGAASAVVPAYITEISPTSIRGRLGTFWQFAIVIGQFLGLLVGFILTRWAGSEAASLPWGGAAWRWMFAVVALLAALYALLASRLPPSPFDPALSRDAAKPGDERGLGILRGSRLGLQGIVWVGILLAAFQQLVGINIVKTYSTSLWRLVGLSTDAAFTISIITVLLSIASTVVAIAIMDKIGRKTLLSVGAAVMALALGTLAICFATASSDGGDVSLGRGAGIAALIAMNVFAVAFGITWGPIMWLMLSELFDSDLRTTAVAVCTAVNWLTNWLVTRSFPTLADIGLGFAYGLYTAFAVMALIFALRVLPETRGRELS